MSRRSRMMVVWKEFKIHGPSDIEEPLSEYLNEIGSAGISIQNSSDAKNLQGSGMDTLWELDSTQFPTDGMILTAYFSEDTDLTHIENQVVEKMTHLKELGFQTDPYSFESNQLKEEDYAHSWKKYYRPKRVSRYLTIVPKWEDYQASQADEQLIYLDPGLAFGTGTHPTTILSLQALEATIRGGETVIDVGTGSGVLTIGSAVLGAKNIFAYDLDDIAVQAAKENVSLNHIEANVELKANDLLKGIDKKADIVVANILADIILMLIPDAYETVKEDGYFICSGIIKEKRTEIEEALTTQGFKIRFVNQMDDWLAFIAQKPED